jgi:tRNA U34 2-thiouridine synthase MnmA/TrmU
MTTQNIKAITLLSGGLDSILATKLVMRQEVTVEAVNFITGFCAAAKEANGCLTPRLAAERLGVEFKEIDISDEILEIVKSPRHGYGSNMNPCIDCHILMLKKAGEYMRSTGASFLVTGEVVGERPMSQKKDMLRHIEKEAGLYGLILRPLSAKLLEPTIPENQGWVDREKLLDIHGRSRRPQIKLANELGIDKYPTPAGGCLLTDPGFSSRVKDLIEHGEFTPENIDLLKTGRHFRISKAAKAIVGRDQAENQRLLALIKDGDVVFKVTRYPGPIVLGRGRLDQTHNDILASIAARYSDAKDSSVEVEYYRHPSSDKVIFRVKKCEQDLLTKIRV